MITGTDVHDRPETAFTIDWNECSRSAGMFDGSTRSRDTDGAAGEMRDVVEAGLNEAASGRADYGYSS